MIKRIQILVVLVSFVVNTGLPSVSFAQSFPIYAAQASLLNLPEPGKMISLSPKFVPAYVKGISIYPNDPFKFDFIIDTGDTKLNDRQFKEESNKLVKYFMAALTVPEKEDWVNLSPYEKDRIIPESLGVTEMGRDMLAQDYILKQLTSSLIYPEKEIGKEFWSKVYVAAQAQFGTTQIPVNTFNKVWIVPSQAVVWEHDNSAYVVRSHLKVMLEQDYLSLNKHLNNNIFSGSGMDKQDAQAANAVGSNVVREVVLPALEKEVNEGANFAAVRQIFNSAILAAWYKQNLQQSIFGQVYANKNKVTGVDLADKQIKQKIYKRYLQAFKKGAFNFIKEDNDPMTHQMIARKYFSGGVVDLATVTDVLKGDFAQLPAADQGAIVKGTNNRVTVDMAQAGASANQAMVAGATNVQSPYDPVILKDWIDNQLNGNGDDWPNVSKIVREMIEGVKPEKLVVGGNWKMAVPSKEKATDLIDGIIQGLAGVSPKDMDVEIFVAPSFMHLPLVQDLIGRMRAHGVIHLAAQDVSSEKPGAFTGDTSVAQLNDEGVKSVILGHSERRLAGETDQQINAKIKAALAGGLKVTLCVGETSQEREAGEIYKVLQQQIKVALNDIPPDQIRNINVAYEPRWAIGTGKTPTDEQINDAHLFIRALLVLLFDSMEAVRVPVIYGGSVKSGNAAAIIKLSNVGGFLVDGDSLKPKEFISIIKAAAAQTKTDKAMVAGVSSFLTVQPLPGFANVLLAQGLLPEKVEITALKLNPGANREVDVLSDVAAQEALNISIGQALGSILFAGVGKEEKDPKKLKEVKEAADGNAVHMGHLALIDSVKRNENIAYVGVGSEGVRDESVGTPLGRFYWSGYTEEKGYIHDTQKENQPVDKTAYENEIKRLRDLNVQIIYFYDDALENTNALKDNEKDAWSVTAFEYDNPALPPRHLLDETDLRRVSVVANTPIDVKFETTDSPKQILEKLAAGFNVNLYSADKAPSEAGKAFAKRIRFGLLGERKAANVKASDNKRHKFYFDGILDLQTQGFPVTFMEFGDGDLMPGIVAASGIGLDDQQTIAVKVGRSGLVEAEVMDIAVSLIPNARSASRVVSDQTTKAGVNPLTISTVQDGLLDKLVGEYGYTKNTFTSERSNGSHRGGTKAVVAMTAVTGADEQRYYQRFADILPKITFDGKNNTVTTSTLLVTAQGVFVVRITLKALNVVLGASKLAILKASSKAREYVKAHPKQFADPAQASDAATEAPLFIRSAEAKRTARLKTTVRKMVNEQGAVIALDESVGTAGKRLAAFKMENTPENRAHMRLMFLGQPDKLHAAGINAAILDRDTFNSTYNFITVKGQQVGLVEYARANGIVTGLKTDGGLSPDTASNVAGEQIPNPKGLAELRGLLEKFGHLADFTKWRVTWEIMEDEKGNTTAMPTEGNMRRNAQVLAEEAGITQRYGLVPMVEPEGIFEKKHYGIDVNYKASTQMWRILAEELKAKGVLLKGAILKTNMITSGQLAAKPANAQEVGFMTLKGLLKEVPAEMGAIVFLSGGQKDDQANENLNAVVRAASTRFIPIRDEVIAELRAEGRDQRANEVAGLTQVPWQISFSFSRGLEQQALDVWQGKKENIPAAQEALNKSAETTWEASQGILGAAFIVVTAFLKQARLKTTVRKMVNEQGAVIALDESVGTAGKRLAAFKMENTPENRAHMRLMFLGQPDKLHAAGINAAILDRDTFNSTYNFITVKGQQVGLVEYARANGIVTGLKTDGGLSPDTASNVAGEQIPNPKGLAELRGLLEKFGHLADFTKWRVTWEIMEDEKGNTTAMPTEGNMRRNAQVLAEEAGITQRYGLVPMVEPEGIFEKKHYGIDVNYKASTQMWRILAEELKAKGVLLKGAILKTNMITSGQLAAKPANAQEVGFMTLKGLLKEVPAEMGAIVFLSGGQKDDQANENLNAVVRAASTRFIPIRDEVIAELRAEGRDQRANEVAGLTQVPWQISFSFSRGLEQQALDVWQGKKENIPAAQEALNKSAETTWEASQGILTEHLADADSAQVSKADAAALTTKPNVEGGINLDPNLYNMQVLRDGNGVVLPISQQPIGQFMKIKGFKPVFLNIERNINLPARLGENLDKLPKERLAQASSVMS